MKTSLRSQIFAIETLMDRLFEQAVSYPKKHPKRTELSASWMRLKLVKDVLKS